jgi:hypothetical protein
MRDTGVKHKGDGKFRQSHHRLSGPIYVDDGFFRPIYVDDGIFCLPCVVLPHQAFVTVWMNILHSSDMAA